MAAPLFAIVFLTVLGSPALAGEPSEVVRPFYLQPGLELEQSARGHFIDPARKVLNQNDAIRQGGEVGCLDPALPFNDTNYDPAEIASTLKLEEIVSGNEATVLAKFMAGFERYLGRHGNEMRITRFALFQNILPVGAGRLRRALGL